LETSSGQSADKRKYRKRSSPEVERLRKILLIALTELMKYDAAFAQKYLNQIDPEDPADRVDDLYPTASEMKH
jgi:hypothetical protein